MPKTVEVKVFKFEELSPEAKAVAIRNWSNDIDYNWSGLVISDIKECAMDIGIDIEKVYFSGFYSQGDGACFEGHIKPVNNKTNDLICPWYCKELQIIGANLASMQEKYGNALYISVRHSGYYCHEYSCTIDIQSDYYPNDVDDVLDITGDDEAIIIEVLREFMRWIYKCLESEYEYQTSDSVIGETLIANDYDFNVDGSMF